MSLAGQQLLQEFEELPIELQHEVIDFMHFVKSRRVKSSALDSHQLLALLQEGWQQGLFASIADADSSVGRVSEA